MQECSLQVDDEAWSGRETIKLHTGKMVNFNLGLKHWNSYIPGSISAPSIDPKGIHTPDSFYSEDSEPINLYNLLVTGQAAEFKFESIFESLPVSWQSFFKCSRRQFWFECNINCQALGAELRLAVTASLYRLALQNVLLLLQYWLILKVKTSILCNLWTVTTVFSWSEMDYQLF